MYLDLSGFNSFPFIGPPAGLLGYVLLGVFTVGLLVALAVTFADWSRLRPVQWGLLFGLALGGVLLAQLFILHIPADILPPPGQIVEPIRPGLALFALVPAFLAGAWLGIGPAIVVGFFTGLARALWETYSVFTPFELALVAGLATACFRQEYRGWLFAALRSPSFAAAVVAGLLAPLLFFSYLAYIQVPPLVAIDHLFSIVLAAAPVFIAQTVIAGLVTEAARFTLPRWWPALTGRFPAPYLRSLNRKLLFTLIPLFVVGIVLLFWADVTIATRVSTGLVLDQMERAAENTGHDIPFFVQTGSSLIHEIASSQDWFKGGNLAQTSGLLQNMRALPFFSQLTLLDDKFQPVAAYPQDATSLPPLSPEQQHLAELALQRSMPQNAVVLDTGGAGPIEMVFMTPVQDPDTRQTVGVLVGRTELQSNPLMQSVVNNLAGLAGGAGTGFIVDEQDVIIYHPNSALVRQTFVPGSGEAVSQDLPTALQGARAYQDNAPDGTRRLVMYYPAAGHPWAVVLMVPNRVVSELAARIATPIIVILLITGLAGLVIVSIIALRVTRPAEELALAAQRISEGQLDQPVVVSGEDEVGRAGYAFERMRQKLRARLSELSLLLKVSQSVSSSLNLEDALPPILQGALSATEASGARIVLASGDEGRGGEALTAFAEGPAAGIMPPLDRGVLELTRREGRVALENLARARAVLDVAPVAGKILALVALPLKQEAMFYGALYLGYDKPHTFSDTEENFLTTLAGQAAVAIANARLFDAAEQGRQRLAAILASTPDAVIVTDHTNHLLLLNPAAEAAFELTGKPVIGRPLAEILPNRELVKLILAQGTRATTGEFEIAAGRTLYASVSPIISADGETLGRVCVLRDVTHFKELDLMKSEFVATVSHDLRAPLTFMRGYATMMPMVGPLNEKQNEFAGKIIVGIEQMTKLIDDLLDLGRIEAGVGLAKEPCRLDEIAQGIVDTLHPVAANKGLHLSLEAPRNLPLVSGDPTLLRQAITNLVDNALKYTPNGGQVRIGLAVDGDKFRVAVSDTGLGVAPADQAHLFEKFFRVKQRGSSQVKGSGLGLAIVKSVIERHGGRVWMESKLGKGSTFYMELPRDNANGSQNQ